MYKTWNDVNLPGVTSGKSTAEPEKKPVTGVDENESAPVDTPVNEVKIISAEWKKGPKGFTYNEQCFVDVKAEYLVKTVRAKLSGKLFGYYNDQEIDMAQTVEGFIDDATMIARMDIKKLWYPNDPHYYAWQKDPDTPCEYMLKNISHTRGANTIDSPKLAMPFEKKIIIDYLELPDVLFNHNSSVPCIDASEILITAIVKTMIFANSYPDKEVVIYGHTDSSGDTAFNVTLSEERAKAVKALIDNDKDAFANICAGRSKVEDYQTWLSVLTKTYHWECDPGSIDNEDGPKTQAAVKSFQADYNSFYGMSIDVAGAVGQQTWGAFFDVINEQIQAAIAANTGDKKPSITYGESGKGVHGCGEQFAQDANTKKGRKSQKDRRVEITFKKPEDQIDETPYTGPIVFEPIVIQADKAEQKIKGFVMQCQHDETVGKKKIYRSAKNDQILEVVADKVLGDKVDFSVLPENPDFPVTWTLKGHQRAEKKGAKAQVAINGISERVVSKWQDFFDKSPRELIPAKIVKITASDDTGGAVTGSIKVYNGFSHTFDLDLSKKWKEISEIIDKIKKGLNFLSGKEDMIEVKKWKGKLSFACGWKEDIYSNKVFFAWGISGGFDPILGLECNIPIPIKGLASRIPQKLLDYGANVDLILTFGGGFGVSVSIEQESPKGTKGTGKGTGSITGSLGGRVRVFNGKLLRVDAKIATGIEGTVYITCHAKNNLSDFALNGNIDVKWNGFKGSVEWQVLDGKFSGKHEVVLVEEQKLWSLAKDPVPLIEWKHS